MFILLILFLLIQCHRWMSMHLIKEMFFHDRESKYDLFHTDITIVLPEEQIYKFSNLLTLCGVVTIFLESIVHTDLQILYSIISMTCWYLFLRLISLNLFLQPDPSYICQSLNVDDINPIVWESNTNKIIFLIEHTFKSFSLTKNQRQTFLTCNDMMFSGHTALHVLVFFQLMQTQSCLAFYYGCCAAASIMLLIVGRIHYTVDILAALGVSYTIIYCHK